MIKLKTMTTKRSVAADPNRVFALHAIAQAQSHVSGNRILHASGEILGTFGLSGMDGFGQLQVEWDATQRAGA